MPVIIFIILVSTFDSLVKASSERKCKYVYRNLFQLINEGAIKLEPLTELFREN